MSEIKIKKTEDIKVYRREYRKNNKNKLNEPIKCDLCGTYYKKENKAHHIKTNKHKTNEQIKADQKQIQELQNKIDNIKKCVTEGK